MEAYPLAWPVGWPRSRSRTRAKFGKGERQYSSAPGSTHSWVSKRDLTINDGTNRVLQELRAFGVLESQTIISSNLALRNDGLPRSGQRMPGDPGVAVYWRRRADNVHKVMAIDRYERVADNLAAIAATLDAMRAIERHGGAQILERAFTGFTALPAPGQTSALGWREALGFPPEGTPDRDDVEMAYRSLRSQYYPRSEGVGDRDKFEVVQRAYEQACVELPVAVG